MSGRCLHFMGLLHKMAERCVMYTCSKYCPTQTPNILNVVLLNNYRILHSKPVRGLGEKVTNTQLHVLITYSCNPMRVYQYILLLDTVSADQDVHK